MADLSRAERLSVSEVVEAQGHLIDSHIMERIFDTVVEAGGRFEVEHFSIGRTNSDPSKLRLRIEVPSQQQMEKLMPQLLGLGCAAVESGDAELRSAERDRCAPEDFYSTTNQRTQVRRHGTWMDVQNQRMDAMIVVEDGRASCRRLRDIKAGDAIVVGMKGIRVVPEAKERDRADRCNYAPGPERGEENCCRRRAGGRTHGRNGSSFAIDSQRLDGCDSCRQCPCGSRYRSGPSRYLVGRSRLGRPAGATRSSQSHAGN